MLTSETRVAARADDDGATVVELQQRREKVAHLFLDPDQGTRSVHSGGAVIFVTRSW